MSPKGKGRVLRVFVRNIEITGFHGVYEEERRDGRRFQIDLSVVIDEQASTGTDELGDTLDYRRLAEIVCEVVHGPSRLLVEKLAGQIVETTLERHPEVREATVEIRKYAPGVTGDPQWVGVELTGHRDES